MDTAVNRYGVPHRSQLWSGLYNYRVPHNKQLWITPYPVRNHANTSQQVVKNVLLHFFQLLLVALLGRIPGEQPDMDYDEICSNNVSNVEDSVLEESIYMTTSWVTSVKKLGGEFTIPYFQIALMA